MNKIIEFESGLKVALAQNKNVRSVAVGINVGAGAAIETAEQSGISHCIEHMVFKGTEKRSAFDIAKDVDVIGAQINAYTSKETTCFYTISLDDHVDECMEILSDIYFNPKFDETEFKRERKVIIEEIAENEDSPEDVCYDVMSEKFFKGSTLEKTILGTKKTLGALTPDIIREYKNKHYNPRNTFIAVAGNISEQKVRELVGKYFEDNFDKQSDYQAFVVPRAVPFSAQGKRKKQIEQSHIGFMFPGYAYGDEKLLATSVLSEIFGGGMSSRLFQTVREKMGLCYTIYSSASAYSTNGFFSIYTSTNPESVESAVRAIGDTTRQFLAEGVTDEELDKAKEQFKTALVLGQESTSSTMRVFGRSLRLTGKLYDIDERIATINKMTKDDVMNTAKEVFDFDKVAAAIVAANTDINVLELLRG